MKHVFSNGQEACHVWANLTPDEIKNGRWGDSSNVHFNGASLRSYATVIARHITGTRGRRAILRDAYTFSSSTGKHNNYLSRAIPDGTEVFYIYAGSRGQSLNLSGKEIYGRIKERAETLIQNSHKPRLQPQTRAGLLEQAREEIRNANRANEFFGLRRKPLSEDLAKLSAEIKAEMDKREARAKEQEEKRKATEAKFRPLFVALWRDRKDHGTEWQALTEQAKAEGISSFSMASTGPDGFTANAILRLSAEGDRVETSQRAQVLVRTVSFLWAFCAKARATKTPVPAETLARFPRLDHYRADEIDGNGNLRAGCHRIAFEEIQSIARALALPPFSEAEALACSPVVPESETVNA